MQSHARGEQAKGGGVTRLGGARADFVASLGRKVADLRVSLARVKATPDEIAPREELRRKLHALGSGAKLMKFDAMERAISEGLGSIDRAEIGVPLEAHDVEAIDQLIEDLPALAWGDGPTRSSVAEVQAKAKEPTHSALVVGKAALADALLEPSSSQAPTFSCESTPDAQAAYDLARSLDPDLIVLDADLPYATELVEALMDDPTMERIPLVVVGSFGASGEGERFVAMGVTKTITKPTSREALREACEDAIDARRPLPATHALLGDPTLEELGETLAKQIRDALLAGVDAKGRARKISLGHGAEVLGPVWGAIARVREVVTARTDGDVRFELPAPEGALAIAPTLGQPDLPFDSRARSRMRGPAGEVRLGGRRVVVADDDPAVVWFLADLLKTAGCTVHEAFDGKQALEAAYKTSPDIVLSDILMPELDGFSLCRALRRDVALRDVPVVLLSWKEDLLQRVRELGANAAGYVRKESDTRAILARMREALRPRAHVETRLRDEQEVRGRLDGVSVRTLLEVVCATRPDARVSVRDASFLYEIEIRSGAPQKAIRTSGDGSVLRAQAAMAAMLGISAGRFTVTASTSSVDADLEGSLAAQLARPIARARAAISLLTGPKMMTVERVDLDKVAMEDYLRATPNRARELVRRMAEGSAPRDLVLEGIVEPSLVEDVVSDLAARGLVHGVVGNGGKDLFEKAVRRAERLTDARAMLPVPEKPVTPTPVPTVDDVVAPARAACMSIAADEPICESPEPGRAGSLEEAVLREVSHRSPDVLHVEVISTKAPMVEASALTPRTSPPETSLLDEDGTPSRSQLLAFAEPTIVDDTVYEQDEPSIPIEESAGLAEAPATPEKTPFASVTTKVDDGVTPEAAGVPSRKLWPLVFFLVAAGIVAWAFLHRTAGSTARRDVGDVVSGGDGVPAVTELTGREIPAPEPATTVTEVATASVAPTARPASTALAKARAKAPTIATATAQPVKAAGASSDELGCTGERGPVSPARF